ncbi:XRE family transcriptional regulator [Bradyrhizobium elkanii]|uniref:XRE family transcriptional regulator n=1 Tax=Bradyrhizobium elkanii TaxID=29448 RepID=UPI0003FDD0A9|nr:XRE family transcriptional regulator [Bradyrhizobium elkanii]
MKSRADEKRSKAHPALGTIKSRVEERVTAAHMSRNEASRRAGLGLSYVNDLLSGKSLNPTRESLAKLASVLDTDVAYFFGEQDTPRIAGLDTNEPSTSPDWRHRDSWREQAGGVSHLPLYRIGLTDPDGFFALVDSRRVTWTTPYGDSDAYAITVPDDTNAPRYRIGEVVIVNPSKPVVHGGFAVVRQTDDRVAIREVVTISPDKISVRCLGDEAITEIPRSKVKSLDRIVGSCELI